MEKEIELNATKTLLCVDSVTQRASSQFGCNCLFLSFMQQENIKSGLKEFTTVS